MKFRTYNDPLHGEISLESQKPAEKMIMGLIDTKPFQRLRRIRQLGPAYLTFHGAESSRFTHSIGVFHIARKSLKRLTKYNNKLKEYEGILYASSLLHDLGHGPLSHTGEEVFGINHESWSAKIVREHPEINSQLESFKPGSSEEVARVLEQHNSSNKLIKSLVSSQLDCDRLDYLLRDSHSTGTRYGQLDLERIISALTLAPDGGIAISPKGLMAVEHYLLVRNLMYRSVYNHRLNEICTWLLERVIRLARQLDSSKLWADKAMSKWIWDSSNMDLESFLATDDIRTGYHLQRWCDDGPKPIAILSSNFLHRNLPKAIAVQHLTNEKQLEILAFARKVATNKGHDPELCCGLRHTKLDGYHPYKGGLRLWDGDELSSLEAKSPLVSSLITPSQTAWLIHPKEIHSDLKKKIMQFNKSA